MALLLQYIMNATMTVEVDGEATKSLKVETEGEAMLKFTLDSKHLINWCMMCCGIEDCFDLLSKTCNLTVMFVHHSER